MNTAARPSLECLEDRTAPSATPVTDPSLFTLIPESATLAEHFHPRLQVYFNDHQVLIPAGIGLTPEGALPLHTHDPRGILHVESTIKRDYALDDFLGVWNQTALGRQVVERLADAAQVAITVNGVAAGSPSSIVLHDRDTIVIHADGQRPGDEAFLRKLYHDLLHREADDAGLAGFRVMLDAGATRDQVVRQIQTSTEYGTAIVQDLYHTYLHRAADPVGLDAYGRYLAGGGKSENVAAALVGSDEYRSKSGSTIDGFLRSLYQDVLHREIDASGAAAWTQSLASGHSRQAIAEHVVRSAEAQERWIDNLYRAYLQRDAEALGLASFVLARQQGTTTDQVFQTILGSEEYYRRH